MQVIRTDKGQCYGMRMNKKQQKKILFIIWSYTYGGGAEALLTTIVNHLNAQKYDISIIEYEHSDFKVEKVNDNIHILPTIERIETPDKQKKGYQVYHTPELLIERYIRGDYDLYVSFNYQIPTFLLPVGTKNIAWIHGNVYDLASEDSKRERMLQDKAFDKVTKIVAISDMTKQSLVDLFPRHEKKIVKIYNGIDIERVRMLSQKDVEDTLQTPNILFVGRLEPGKRPERLIHIIKLLHQRGAYFHLYFMGDGVLRESLEKQAEQLKLEGYIHFMGYVQCPFPYIVQSNVVSLLSDSEGFSMCLLEAVALGVPFVSTGVGGAETLSNGRKCGKIIETDEEAADAVLEWVNADQEEVRRECQKSIERFALGKYIAQIEELFDIVME